jgi:uroporphyrinogen III methyltransferase/synthase
MITFTSGSTATHFKKLGLPLPQGLKTASIGPVTSKEMRKLGLSVDLEAAQHDISDLVESIRAFYQSKKERL